MFFTRRRWALRVTEKMELNPSSQIASEIVSMIIQGSKQFNKMFRQANSKLSKQEQILMSAAALRDNYSAINRLTTEFKISNQEARNLFAKAKNSAYELAIENDFNTLLESSCFKK